MKTKVNNNFIWANTFVNQLDAMGVKYACISPGSRSTPLTYSLAVNNKIKCFINIDERSSAFFALGLAKASNTPVLIVTTSGTATAELYPAIIEAYQQRTPLIICTADRPPELIGTGANQAINQYNLYRNHIRWFRDVGLPSTKEHSLRYLQRVAFKSYKISSSDKGPVHINFPLKKPLEPFTFNDEADEKLFSLKPLRELKKDFSKIKIEKDRKVNRVAELMMHFEKGLIVAGPMEYNAEAANNIKDLASVIKYPILADGVSHLRFKISKSNKNVIANYHSFLSSNKFCKKYKPDFILHFGGTPTSANLINYLADCDAERFQVNEYGDLHDPSRKTKMILNYLSSPFTEAINDLLSKEKFERKKSKWFATFAIAESISERVISGNLAASRKLNEPKIVSELIKLLPSKTKLFIANSLPIRDFDYFSGISSKSLNLFFNRGASGIDGIVSTALGIAAINKPTVLLVGDLSFLHDINSLLSAKNNNIPITIVLINNNGGGIFQTLPISEKRKLLKEYFINPHNLHIAKIVEAFGVKHKLIKNKSELKIAVNNLKLKAPIVLEIKTNANESVKLRKKIFKEVKTEIGRQFTR
jgi:2-succinyl-5-enolpyruvyl-6-hydroxy-3-cyclohexene-1-carboxylate synthase